MLQKLTLIIGLVIIACSGINAQEIHDGFRYSSQFYFQMPTFNPAYAGHYTQPNVSLSYMPAKVNDNKTKYVNFNIHANTPKLNGALGLFFNSQETPEFTDDYKFYQIGAQYSYNIDIGEKGNGRFGLSVGLLHNEKDITRSSTSQTFTQVNEQYFKVNLDLGFLMMYGDFNFGVALAHTNEPKFNEPSVVNTGGGGGGNPDPNNNVQSFSFPRTGIVSASYDIKVMDGFFVIPSVILRQPLGESNANSNKLRSDLGLLLNYGNRFMLGYHQHLESSKVISGTNSGSGQQPIETDNQVYFGSLMAAMIISDTFQVSFSYDLRNKNYKDSYNRFEIGLGLYMPWGVEE